MARDLTVTARDGIELAVRDHGGDGPALVMMHGAGTHLLSLERLVHSLSGYRVVALDQRWSGQSGDSDTYRWSDLVDDVEVLIAALDLGNPAVGGHSWGGMIAVHYGLRHPEAPAVINIDGHGPGDPSLYEGMTQAEAVAALARLQAVDQPPDRPLEGDAAWKLAALADHRGLVLGMGIPEDRADAFAERSFVRIGPDHWRHHPSPPLFAGLRGDQAMFDLYSRLEAPLLVVLAPGLPPGLPEAVSAPLAAYRRGLARAFAERVEPRPSARVVTLHDAHHNSVLGRHAPPTAEAIDSFLVDRGYRS